MEHQKQHSEFQVLQVENGNNTVCITFSNMTYTTDRQTATERQRVYGYGVYFFGEQHMTKRYLRFSMQWRLKSRSCGMWHRVFMW